MPDDLKGFFLASNGWNQMAFDAWDLRVLSAQELVAGARLIDQSYFRDVAEYFSSDDPPHKAFRGENLQRIVLLSDECQDGCYFAVPSTDAWDYGVIRFHSEQQGFPSFAALMESERQMCTYFLRGNI